MFAESNRSGATGPILKNYHNCKTTLSLRADEAESRAALDVKIQTTASKVTQLLILENTN